ncbi:hypothetical protein JG688_00004027 [Phytophthora aleatoria]|uniref:Uncharacterized protein n=1 Tax=Phytophthora aleatoria TaxID=2496075 RepID=A0A8J5J1A8_9STRA|nr:hypothetical protein JG688_00004027 [Phytophthora aleatoria]
MNPLVYRYHARSAQLSSLSNSTRWLPTVRSARSFFDSEKVTSAASSSFDFVSEATEHRYQSNQKLLAKQNKVSVETLKKV